MAAPGAGRRRVSRGSSGSSSKGPKASILFVDDEQRVLNSMRALFRRDYDLHLTTRGAEAIDILREHQIDVIVADQRMPEMTGVEVLGAGKEVSPQTVRILLTGYADLDAIEGSINIGEVFRFLSKPCPPSHLRQTLRLAVEIAQSGKTTPASNDPGEPARAPESIESTEEQPGLAEGPQPAKPAAAPTLDDTAEILVDAGDANREPVADAVATVAHPAAGSALEDTAEILVDNGVSTIAHERTFSLLDDTVSEEIVLETPAAHNGDDDEFSVGTNSLSTSDTVRRPVNAVIGKVGVIVFSSSASFADSVEEMLGTEHYVRSVKTLVEVTEVLEQGICGVLVTDFVSEGRVLRRMIATLKRYLPELVTIVLSNDRDASEMISLINHGQIFRFMSKPVQRDRFIQNVNAAALKHVALKENPELLKRHQVEADSNQGDIPAAFTQFVKRLRGVGRLFARS